MAKKDDNIELEYWDEVELTDPTTGSKYKQKVKIIKYKSLDFKEKGITEELEDSPPVILPEEDFDDQE